MHTFTATIKSLIVIIILLIIAGLVYIYSGAYNIGTDVHHNSLTHWILSTVRERSIKTHAEGIKVPPLSDPEMIEDGAHHYARMCSGCHLAPGMPDTEIRQGLYPRPPELGKHKALDPATAFWIIKHGIKFTAMPGWGATHDDAVIWSIVAFVEKLPSLSPDEYAAMTHGNGHAAPAVAAPASAASSAAPASNSSVATPAPATSAAPASQGSPPP